MPNELNDQDDIKDENESESYQNQIQPLSRNQKIAVAVLAIFGVLVVIFWAVQFKANIKKPLQHNTGATNSSDSVDSSADSGDFNADDEALKTKDTDGDGLTDWDELHTYKTSPYLEDTDGDGYNDKQEIDTGNDPNCPRGQTCEEVKSDTSQTNTQNSGTTATNGIDLNALLGGTSQTSDTGVGVNANSSANQVGGSVDAKTLRAALEANGFDKEMLSKISDEELIKTYNESLNSTTNTN